MKRLLGLIFCLLTTQAAADWREGAGYLELVDRLDRPQDGYCLDVPGSGEWVDFNLPLNAHNCKRPGLYADEAVTFTSPGSIRFPAYEGCVTAVGLNGRSLPGAALMLKPCVSDHEQPFSPFISAGLQHFVHREDGLIELSNSGLCISVGEKSDRTFSPSHRWRTLFLDECSLTDTARSIWKPVNP